jgi:hypothetical protein
VALFVAFLFKFMILMFVILYSHNEFLFIGEFSMSVCIDSLFANLIKRSYNIWASGRRDKRGVEKIT